MKMTKNHAINFNIKRIVFFTTDDSFLLLAVIMNFITALPKNKFNLSLK